jgi:hypothetical protein
MLHGNMRLRIGRREFSERGLLLLLSGVTITISGCGSSSSAPATTPTPTPTPAPATDVAGVISANHGHTAVVTAAQITAANAVTLHIQGTATHDHTVDLSAAQIGQIGSKQQVAMDSSNNAGHLHTVTFN